MAEPFEIEKDTKENPPSFIDGENNSIKEPFITVSDLRKELLYSSASRAVHIESSTANTSDINDVATVALPSTIYTDSTITTLADSTDATILKGLNMRFNDFIKGRIVRVYAAGVFSQIVNESVTVTLYFAKNGSTQTSHGVIGSNTDAITGLAWYIDWYVLFKTTGTSGSAESKVHGSFYQNFTSSGGASAVTVDTTTLQQLQISAQWSSANAGNTISIRQFFVQIL